MMTIFDNQSLKIAMGFSVPRTCTTGTTGSATKCQSTMKGVVAFARVTSAWLRL